MKSSKVKELQGLLKADESLANAFKKVKLSTMPIGKNDFVEKKMVVKFFSSPNFKAWSKHAATTNPQNPQAAMLTALTNVFGEKNVATMILLGKIPELQECREEAGSRTVRCMDYSGENAG